jgi:ADP-heptose:LPS heptosyltransferase
LCGSSEKGSKMRPAQSVNAAPSVAGNTGSKPDRLYAKPRPMMRNGYLVRSNKAVAVLRTIDVVLNVFLPNYKRTRPSLEPKRILVSNWAHLGDVITSLPTLRCLRESFPAARIDVLVGSGSRVVLEGSGLCDRIHTLDHFLMDRSNDSRQVKIRRYLRDRRRFLTAAKSEQYEIGIDLYPFFPPASPLFWAARIPVRCGFTSGGFGPLLTHPTPWVYKDKPMTQYGKELISAVWPELNTVTSRFAPYYPNGDELVLPRHLEPPDPHYVVMHIGAGASWKEWPEANWCSLIAAWPRTGPLLIIAGNGPEEEARARRIAASSPQTPSVLFVNNRWNDFVALLAGAAGLICLESSGSHVAAAFSIPTVAIYSGTNEHRLWAPDSSSTRILTAPTACAPCHRTGCDAMACIRGVTPDDVLAAIDDVIFSRSTLNMA